MALQARGLKGLARSTTVAAAVVAMGFGVAGCTGAGESSDGTAPNVSADGASTSGGASDGGGDSAAGGVDASVGIPEENKDLKPPVFDDYPGITENTDEGAEQTLKYFFDAAYYGFATGDTEALEKVAGNDDCGPCVEMLKDIRSNVESGRYLVPGKRDIIVLEYVGEAEDGASDVYIKFDRGEFVNIDTTGGRKEYQPSQVTGAARMAWSESGNWEVHNFAWDEE